MRSVARAVRRLYAGGMLCALLLTCAASAAAAPAPRNMLLQAERRAHALAGQATTSSVSGPASSAAAALARATFPELWLSAREADAPPYGARVFAGSAAALRALQRISDTGAEGMSDTIKLILVADRGLAEGAIAEARGEDGRLLVAARRALAAGNRAAAAGHASAAVRSYSAAWESAFGALTKLVATEVTTVPPAALAAAAEQALTGAHFGMAGPRITQGPVLSARGKPEVFFAGSEACPFCGVQRWGMIVALAQFGTFTNLHLMQSLPTQPPPVRTFTFFGSAYQSPYVSFVPVEVWSNVRKGFGFARLQPLTPLERSLMRRFDPRAQTPFIDVANHFITVNSTVDPHLIGGRSWTQIASSLADPANIGTQAIAGEAEVFTAELCEATSGKPQPVCSAPVVQHYEAALPTLTGHGGSCPAPPSPMSMLAQSVTRSSSRRAGPVATAAHCGV